MFRADGASIHREVSWRAPAAILCALVGCSGRSVVGGNGRELQLGAGGGESFSQAGGSSGVEDPACVQPAGDPYLPLAPGTEWTFLVRDNVLDLDLPSKRHRVLELEDGVAKVEITGDRPGFRWIRDSGTEYLWVRNVYLDPEGQGSPVSDQYYEPAALRLDYSRTQSGDTWTRRYQKIVIDISRCPGWTEAQGRANLDACPAEAVETSDVDEVWTVTQAGRVVNVPAGEFTALCHSRICATEAQCITGEYCFSPGVGKVWEESNQHEELESFCVSARK
jgi:hypothetical protein